MFGQAIRLARLSKVTFYAILRNQMNVKDVPDYMLSRGRFSASTAEISELTGVPQPELSPALGRLRDRKLTFSPARGLYFFVPPEYRSWGVVPGQWMIDDVMRHLRRGYYVALLSAAEMHGASHHAPQVFQVIVDRHTASRDLGRVRLRFVEDRDAADAAVEKRNVPTGTVRLSTKEQTAVDLVCHHRHAGGWNNVATVLGDLEGLDGEHIARLAARRPVAVMRRLGWLLDNCAQEVDTDPLAQAARRPTAGATLLEPSEGRAGPVDVRWALILNTEVEPDR
ncbi:MAG: type IV toxin-antitoxin system AbiEi family antitoxin domain-containing protein [Solirubrobacteraceae bacterium]